MMGFRAWPYAAKAIITHEFDTDHLDIWVTFRFPMDQTVKPANALWISKVEEVLKTVVASAWQDAYTMLLTTEAIASIPDKVTLAYDGPDENLRTTWDKHWEPWGAILSSDGTLLPYGSFKGNEINWIQVAAIGTWYIIGNVNVTVNLQHKTVFQNNRELKITVNGIYQISYYLSLECSIANKHVLSSILINGAPQEMGQTHHEFGRANEEESWGASGQYNLFVDDVIRVGVATDDAGNPTLTANHVGLTLTEIGKS